MTHHLSFATANLPRAAAFYDATLATLGHRRVCASESFVGYGQIDDADFFSLKLRSDGVTIPGDGFHLAFAASTRAAVDAFYQAALQHSGTDNGGCGLHPEYGDHYYAAFVLDPDGYWIEAVICGPS